MLIDFFRMGGPVMWLVLAAWVVVLAVVLDRIFFWFSALVRHPFRRVIPLAEKRGTQAALAQLDVEIGRAEHGLARLDAASQLATSLGLFGTVLGIAQVFFSRGQTGGGVSPEALGAGLSTALFTTIAGLAVFLFGQTFLAIFSEFGVVVDRRVRAALLKREAR